MAQMLTDPTSAACAPSVPGHECADPPNILLASQRAGTDWSDILSVCHSTSGNASESKDDTTFCLHSTEDLVLNS